MLGSVYLALSLQASLSNFACALQAETAHSIGRNPNSYQLPHSYPETSEMWSWPGARQTLHQSQQYPWPNPSQHEPHLPGGRLEENLNTLRPSDSFDRIYASFQHPRWGNEQISHSSDAPGSQPQQSAWPQVFNRMLPGSHPQSGPAQNSPTFSTLMDNRTAYSPGMFTVRYFNSIVMLSGPV